MLDEAEIRKEIARLEYEESSYPNYAKLADLYTIRNQMQDGQGGSRFVGYYSADPAPAIEEPKTVGEYGDSDFLLAVSGKDPAKAWAIVDELMDTLAMVNSKVYNSVMQKIKRI